MNGLRLYVGNRLESLLDELSGVIESPLSSPLAKETIVVQSIGMSRWLSLEIARRHGICANIEFPFPQAFFQEIFCQSLRDPLQSKRYEPEFLAWRIMQTLPSLLANSAFQRLRRYLEDGQPELRRYQLAKKIAVIFDEYLVFRPDWILKWDEGYDDDWQAQLWRAISHGAEEAHLPAMAKHFIESLTANSGESALPQRISIFGISTLSKFYLDLFEAVALRTEVNLFLMQPTSQEWTEIRSSKEESRTLRKHKELTAEDLHIERGNPLLASFGKAGREFAANVVDLEIDESHEVFAKPHDDSILAQMQRDIYELNDPLKTMAVSENDESIQIHSCHSAMREIEVLHDRLLEMFARDPALNPRDILVVMPDVQVYAPLIEAVFGVPENEQVRIPFSIADRALRADSGAVDAFLKLLNLAGSRLAVSEVLPLLEIACVREKFAISEPEMETIFGWIKATQIRWGRNARHRAQFGVPAFAQNSWRAGIDRMLLGYAMRGESEKLFAGILPFDEIEGSATETLGKFVAFIESLFSLLEKLEQPHSIGGWSALLRFAVSDFFVATSETERDLLPLRKAFDALDAARECAGFEDKIGIEIMRAHLADAIEKVERRRGFLEGKVTFGALKPLRSIPFKVICLIGMSDGCFPRKQQSMELNRMAKERRPGDRSIRDDDRYLFLELLLSARTNFYLSYIGQSHADNSALPPSVVVSELRDYLVASFGEAVVEGLETIHPLQPFNPRYFSTGKLWSYSRENFEAAKSLRTQPERQNGEDPWCGEPFAEADVAMRNPGLGDLIRFFKNPAEYFLKMRLGITLRDEEAECDDHEPLQTHKLDEYRWKQSLTASALSGSSLADVGAILRASGDFPPESSGALAIASLQTRAQEFAKTVREKIRGELREPLEVALQIDEFTVSGKLDGIYTESGLVQFRCADLKAKDVLSFWISLLAANCANEKINGVLIAEKKCWLVNAPPNARELLGSLLAIYWRGLQSPCAFFPQTSFTYATALRKENPKSSPIEEAQKAWSEAWNDAPKECEDAYFALAFRNVENPLDAAWMENAKAVFDPWFDHAEEEK